MHNGSICSYGVLWISGNQRTWLWKIGNSHSWSTVASPPTILKVIWRSRTYHRKTNPCIATMDISKSICAKFQISSLILHTERENLLKTLCKVKFTFRLILLFKFKKCRRAYNWKGFQEPGTYILNLIKFQEKPAQWIAAGTSKNTKPETITQHATYFILQICVLPLFLFCPSILFVLVSTLAHCLELHHNLSLAICV